LLRQVFRCFNPTGSLSTNDEVEQGRADISLDQYRFTGDALRLLSAKGGHVQGSSAD